MTKQEKVREESHKIIDEEICTSINGEAWIPDSGIDRLFNYLHSQDVVFKVDRELPEHPIKVTTYLGLTEEEANTRQLESDCFMQVIQDEMLKVGYVATEPLIKEGDENVQSNPESNIPA